MCTSEESQLERVVCEVDAHKEDEELEVNKAGALSLPLLTLKTRSDVDAESVARAEAGNAVATNAAGSGTATEAA